MFLEFNISIRLTKTKNGRMYNSQATVKNIILARPLGIEPKFQAPETCVISIGPRAHELASLDYKKNRGMKQV